MTSPEFEAFYDSFKRNWRGSNILEDMGLCLQYVKRRYGIPPMEFFMLCKLTAMGTFLKDDVIHACSISWKLSQGRWSKLTTGGWVEVVRRRSGGKNNYNLFGVTTKTTRLVREVLKYLAKEKKIPVNSIQDVGKGGKTSRDRGILLAIQDFNRAVEAKQKE